MIDIVAPRTVWPPGFPEVVVHTELSVRNRNPHYLKAKSGDDEAATLLVQELVNPEMIQHLKGLISDKSVMVAAVAAIEAAGFNAIPDAFANYLCESMGLILEEGELVQTNKVAHTRAKGWHPIVTPPTFAGSVSPGATYLLVDDHVGFGGTLTNLKGYIEANGGRVAAMTTLTKSRDAQKISLTQSTLDMLRSRHGKELEAFWHEHFHYGLDCLTEIEGSNLARELSFDAIRDKLFAASEEASSGGLSPVSFES